MATAIPDSGSKFYRDDWGTLYLTEWTSSVVDGVKIFDFSSIIKQPYVWNEIDQGYIKNKHVFRRGIVTYKRSIIECFDDGYNVKSEGFEQKIEYFDTTFPCHPVPTDNFSNHLNEIVTDECTTLVTSGSCWVDGSGFVFWAGGGAGGTDFDILSVSTAIEWVDTFSSVAENAFIIYTLTATSNGDGTVTINWLDNVVRSSGYYSLFFQGVSVDTISFDATKEFIYAVYDSGSVQVKYYNGESVLIASSNIVMVDSEAPAAPVLTLNPTNPALLAAEFSGMTGTQIAWEVERWDGAAWVATSTFVAATRNIFAPPGTWNFRGRYTSTEYGVSAWREVNGVIVSKLDAPTVTPGTTDYPTTDPGTAGNCWYWDAGNSWYEFNVGIPSDWYGTVETGDSRYTLNFGYYNGSTWQNLEGNFAGAESFAVPGIDFFSVPVDFEVRIFDNDVSDFVGEEAPLTDSAGYATIVPLMPPSGVTATGSVTGTEVTVIYAWTAPVNTDGYQTAPNTDVEFEFIDGAASGRIVQGFDAANIATEYASLADLTEPEPMTGDSYVARVRGAGNDIHSAWVEYSDTLQAP